MNSRIIVIALLGLSLVTTATLTGCSKREQGTAIGGVVGGVVGSRFGGGSGKLAMTALGAIAGAYIGGNIGQSMDDEDRRYANNALENNRTNTSASWKNPDSGNRYTVTPTRTYETNRGPCREYTTKAVINGRAEVIHGTACRQPDGSWIAAN